ncbi:hypothetical protein ACKTEK_14180 [Tepidamorphus sp. 3E244]|uniref:hypothetical protein n=1 Tax=Tepidamorphus sp. 3E244 TaxID=3385498 RepID=UPI0038FCDCAB
MRKFVMPIMAAAFLAIAGTAAMPNTANAGSVSVGIQGNGFGIYYNDGDRNRGGHRRHYRARRSCEPIYRTQRHWTRHGWKRMRVHVGYHCDRIPRGYRGHRR